MAKTEHYYTKLIPGNFYHIYNRSISESSLFQNEKNHEFFIRKLDFYLSPVLELFAWCLMGNHFHLLVRIKTERSEEELIVEEVHLRFRKLFQSYAVAFNLQEKRHGALFQKPFKRAHVDSPEYFTQMVYYIHANPQKHGFAKDFREYKWSSYHSFLDTKNSKLKKAEVLDWFGGMEGFLRFHAEGKLELEKRLLIEDD